MTKPISLITQTKKEYSKTAERRCDSTHNPNRHFFSHLNDFVAYTAHKEFLNLTQSPSSHNDRSISPCSGFLKDSSCPAGNIGYDLARYFVGFQAGVASSLVDLDLDLDEIETAVTMEDGLEYLQRFQRKPEEAESADDEDDDDESLEGQSGMNDDQTIE